MSTTTVPPTADATGPVAPPSAIDRLLADARSRIRRVRPRDAAAVVAAGGWLIDLRPAELRWRDGEVPGATAVSRHVLEWRLDPTSPHRLAGFDHHDTPVVLLCTEGYTSSLAADLLVRDLGLTDVCDVVGGFHAWRDAGLGWLQRDESIGPG